MPVNAGHRPFRVLLHGLPYFCEKLLKVLQSEDWDVRFHALHSLWALPKLLVDLARCDLAFTWGGRISMGKFLWAARFLGRKNIVILWCGSDVLYAKEDLKAGKLSSWVAEKIHWAASPVLTEEVRAFGVECKYVQVSFVDPVKDIEPLPAKFSVLAYVPGLQKGPLYGLDQIQRVAKAMPDVEFNIVGWPQGDHLTGPPNLKVHGLIRDLRPFFRQTIVVWRPVQHDAGVSFMVLEALAQGRHVIYSYPFPACIKASTAESAQLELERLCSLHASGSLNLNDAGIKIASEEFSPQRVRSTLLRKWAESIRSSTSSPARLPKERKLESSSRQPE